MDELREELAESIKNMDLVMERRKGQAGMLVPAIIILSVIFAGIVLAQADERQAALSAMDKAQGWISEMEQMGFPANRANDTLNEAKLLFSKGFYQGAESMANDVEGLKNRAISISSTIDEVEASLYQARSMGINASQPQELFDQALNTFQMEDYERAEELLSQASARVSEGIGLEGLLKKIQDNIIMVLIAAAILISAVTAGIRVRRKRKILGRIGRLGNKADRLNSMIKDIQLKYFQKGEMSESEYRNLMERYRKRLAIAKRRKLALEGTLKKPEKAKA
jgi:tetratricopeptide (TPR) repeat protein